MSYKKPRYTKMYARANELYQQPIEVKVTTTTQGSSYDPDAFGPAFWFTFHNATTTYPNRPTIFVQDGMKKIIGNMPLLIPCLACKEHFFAFLKTVDLDQATSSRENLFKFFVDAHNYVNRRFMKPEMSLSDAKKMYGFDKPGVGSMVRITYS
jgi:hypothetical protein